MKDHKPKKLKPQDVANLKQCGIEWFVDGLGSKHWRTITPMRLPIDPQLVEDYDSELHKKEYEPMSKENDEEENKM